MAALVFLLVVALLFLCTAVVDHWLPGRRPSRLADPPEPIEEQAVDPHPDPADRDDARDPEVASPGPDLTADRPTLSDEGQLAELLLGGSMCPAEYRLAMADLAFEEDLRRPMVVPPDMRGA